jgi:hypothetical protein
MYLSKLYFLSYTEADDGCLKPKRLPVCGFCSRDKTVFVFFNVYNTTGWITLRYEDSKQISPREIYHEN